MELKTQGTDLEEALAESENRFRCLIEYPSDGNGNVVDVDSSACEAYGYPRDELAGLSLRDLWKGTARSNELTEVDEALCGGAARTIEVTAPGRAHLPGRGSRRAARGPSGADVHGAGAPDRGDLVGQERLPTNVN
jgi:PAS domain-containing protein